MKCYCFLRNACDVQHYGTTPYFRRFGEQYPGHKIPFGAEIGYLKGVLGELAGLRDHPDIDPAVLGHLDFLARQARLERIAQLFRERS